MQSFAFGARIPMKHIPFGRLGDPLTDIAPAVAFRVSDASAFVTGQMFTIDGGLYVSPT